MTKTTLWCISVIAFISAIILPLCLNNDSLDVVNTISSLISSLCGAVTLLIAILLYNKYGIDQTVTDKNLKIVLEILSELKKIVLFAERGGEYFAKLSFETIDFFKIDQQSDNDWLESTVYFQLSYASALERLFELSRDPFAPKEIAMAIRRLELFTLSIVNDADRVEGCAIVYAQTSKNTDNSEAVGLLNGKEMSLRDFIRKFQFVKSSIREWLISHNVNENSLNF